MKRVNSVARKENTCTDTKTTVGKETSILVNIHFSRALFFSRLRRLLLLRVRRAARWRSLGRASRLWLRLQLAHDGRREVNELLSLLLDFLLPQDRIDIERTLCLSCDVVIKPLLCECGTLDDALFVLGIDVVPALVARCRLVHVGVDRLAEGG